MVPRKGSAAAAAPLGVDPPPTTRFGWWAELSWLAALLPDGRTLSRTVFVRINRHKTKFVWHKLVGRTEDLFRHLIHSWMAP
jgi:hypothetical protein